MKRLFSIVLVVIFFAGFSPAPAHAGQNIFEAVGSLVVGVVTLPVAIISGVATGLAGGGNSANSQLQATYYYNQPMYGIAPPFNPGYQFQTWYWQPNGIVFVSGNNHYRHNYNHGGTYQGRSLQHRQQIQPQRQQGRRQYNR